jgi:hypothetical protein
MKQNRVLAALVLLLAAFPSASTAIAQSSPTAGQPMQLSAFGTASGVFTTLGNGHNVSITAGVDLALPGHRLWRPVVEVRGTYPVNQGTVDAEKSVLGGLRVNFLLGHRLHPYGDFLFGRGETDYLRGGYLYNGFVYQLTTTYIYSPGGGVEFDVNDHLAVKADAQVQRWSNAPTASGALYPTVASVGVVYNFDFNHHRERRR